MRPKLRSQLTVATNVAAGVKRLAPSSYLNSPNKCKKVSHSGALESSVKQSGTTWDVKQEAPAPKLGKAGPPLSSSVKQHGEVWDTSKKPSKQRITADSGISKRKKGSSKSTSTKKSHVHPQLLGAIQEQRQAQRERSINQDSDDRQRQSHEAFERQYTKRLTGSVSESKRYPDSSWQHPSENVDQIDEDGRPTASAFSADEEKKASNPPWINALEELHAIDHDEQSTAFSSTADDEDLVDKKEFEYHDITPDTLGTAAAGSLNDFLPLWLTQTLDSGTSWRTIKSIWEDFIPCLAEIDDNKTLDSLSAHTAHLASNPGLADFYYDSFRLNSTSGLNLLKDYIHKTRRLVPASKRRQYDACYRGSELADRIHYLDATPGYQISQYQSRPRDDVLYAGESFKPLHMNSAGVDLVEVFMIPIICDWLSEKYHAEVFAIAPASREPDSTKCTAAAAAAAAEAAAAAAHGGRLFKALAIGYFHGLRSMEHSPLPKHPSKRGQATSNVVKYGVEVTAHPLEYGAAAILRAWEDSLALTISPFAGPSRSALWSEILFAATGTLPHLSDPEGHWYTEIFERFLFKGPLAKSAKQLPALEHLWRTPERVAKLCVEGQELWKPRADGAVKIPVRVVRRWEEEAVGRVAENERRERGVVGRAGARRERDKGWGREGMYPVQSLEEHPVKVEGEKRGRKRRDKKGEEKPRMGFLQRILGFGFGG